MAATIQIAPRTTVVEKIIHRFHYDSEDHRFVLVTPDGEQEFHWLCEPSSYEREGSEQALKRLSKALGITFEYEEVA